MVPLKDWLGDNLPAINATLNFFATILLVFGLLNAKRGRLAAHKRGMLAAFGVSCLFLACYLLHKAIVQRTHPYDGPESLAPLYRTILWSHIVLAASVPFLAGRTIFLGLRDRRAEHRKLAKWTFPIWLYVSVTGVVIYFMLYLLPTLAR